MMAWFGWQMLAEFLPSTNWFSKISLKAQWQKTISCPATPLSFMQSRTKAKVHTKKHPLTRSIIRCHKGILYNCKKLNIAFEHQEMSLSPHGSQSSSEQTPPFWIHPDRLFQKPSETDLHPKPNHNTTSNSWTKLKTIPIEPISHQPKIYNNKKHQKTKTNKNTKKQKQTKNTKKQKQTKNTGKKYNVQLGRFNMFRFPGHRPVAPPPRRWASRALSPPPGADWSPNAAIETLENVWNPQNHWKNRLKNIKTSSKSPKSVRKTIWKTQTHHEKQWQTVYNSDCSPFVHG